MKITKEWIFNNIFSIITLIITLGGFIAGYARLEYKVENMQKNLVDKEIVRTVAKEVLTDKLAVVQKDIDYIKEKLDKQGDLNKAIYRHMAASNVSFDQDKELMSKVYSKK